MANEQIMREADLGLSTVKLAKRWLKENGWLLADKAAYKNEFGKWISPEFAAAFPGVETNLRDDSQGSNTTYGPGPKTNPRSRVEKAAAVNSTLPVDTLLSVNTGGSDAIASSLDTEKEEAVEERRSASSASLSNLKTVTVDDYERHYQEHVINDYLLPFLSKIYHLNGNCNEEVASLFPLLKANGFAEANLPALIEFFRNIPDTFVAERIATWNGLKTMMKKGGMFAQWAAAQKIASKLNPKAFQAAQLSVFGTAAYGAAIADIRTNGKKAKVIAVPVRNIDEEDL